jgi:hypothetical protein
VTATIQATGMLSCTDLSNPMPDPLPANVSAYVIISTRDNGIGYTLSAAPEQPTSQPGAGWFAGSDGTWIWATAEIQQGEAPAPWCELTYSTLTIERPTSSTLHLDVRGRSEALDDLSACMPERATADLRNAACSSAGVWDAAKI